MIQIHDTGCLGLVHWDDPEGGYGEGGGRRVQDGEHMYTCGGCMLYSPKKYKWDYLGCLYLLVVVTNNALTINVDLQTISKQMLITLFLYYSLTYLV